jgi:hypothetical protein
MHRRLRPVVHAFSYPVFFIQLSLRDLAAANCAIFSVDRANLLSFRSRDHGARDGSALLPWMQARLRAHGLPDDGEIVLQCFPRVFGFVFNPVSFWFCHDRGGGLIAVLAEVNNTFGGHHQYLLHAHGAVLEDGLSLSAQKAFHVSPFCRVEGSYRFRFRSNATAGQAVIDYDDGAGALLLTSIAGTPRSWSAGALLAAFLRMPLLTAGVVWRIHWQALRLLCKRVPFFGVDPASASPSNTKSRP